jgi:hypothetical protein
MRIFYTFLIVFLIAFSFSNLEAEASDAPTKTEHVDATFMLSSRIKIDPLTEENISQDSLIEFHDGLHGNLNYFRSIHFALFLPKFHAADFSTVLGKSYKNFSLGCYHSILRFLYPKHAFW